MDMHFKVEPFTFKEILMLIFSFLSSSIILL